MNILKRWFVYKYFGTSEGIIFSLVIFLISSWTLPVIGKSENIKLILTVCSFLFGVIAGFYIAHLLSRFQRYTTLASEEAGSLENIYKFSEILGKKYAEKMSNLIDNYVAGAFDYEFYEYPERLSKQYFAFFEPLKKTKARTPEKKEAVEQMYDTLEILTKTRKEMIALGGGNRLKISQWFILIILASVLIFCLFYIRTDEWASLLSTALLSSAIVSIFLFIRDLNNFEFADHTILFDVHQRVFDLIGKPRYYPIDSLEKRMLKIPKNKDYRVAYFNKKGKKIKMKLVKVEKT